MEATENVRGGLVAHAKLLMQFAFLIIWEEEIMRRFPEPIYEYALM